MGMMKEFKQFAMKGNVLDLAVAVVIGAAFGRIITSLVNDILMPPIGMLLGNTDFSKFVVVLKSAHLAIMEGDKIIKPAMAAVTVNYGLFIQTIINFLIVAFSIFMVIRAMNKAKKKKEEAPAAPPKPSDEVVLLSEIRDLLKK